MVRRVKSIVESVISSGRFKPLTPSYSNVARPQLEMFDFSNQASHVSMGDFYEMVTRGFYGGELSNWRILYDEDESHLIKPDLVSKLMVGESKSCCSGHTCNLIDDQIERYKQIQNMDNHAETYFALYRHNFKDIKSWKGDEKELFKQLGQKTLFSIRLPFSLILHLHRGLNGEGHEFVYHYKSKSPEEEKPYPDCTCIRSSTINRIFEKPVETIEAMRLNPEDYKIKRFLSPDSFIIEGASVKQFPVVYIADKAPRRWIKDFVRGNYDSKEDLFLSLENNPF